MVDDKLKRLIDHYEVGDLLNGTVLIVDDDVPNLEVLSGVLETDYDVFMADSGEAALEIMDSEPLDVIISDQRMPEMTGVELLERVGEKHSDIAGIVLTAYTDSPAIIEAINRAGAFRFMTKPWDKDDILVNVAQACSHVFQRRAIVRLVNIVSVRNEELALAVEDLRSAQKQIRHMERLGTMGRLTSGITHDIRNFLMGLALLEEECGGRNIDDEFKDIVTISLAGVRNLLGSLEAMNRFARDEEIDVSFKRVEPSSIIRDAITVMHMDLEYRKREVIEEVTDGLPEVRVDRQRMVQVLVNLIRNAVQATEPGKLITIEASSNDKGDVVLAVEDQGSGIPPELKGNLFDAFASSKGDQGMGMGLYMARQTVESHGGTIECTDTEGGGTRFEIRLTETDRFQQLSV